MFLCVVHIRSHSNILLQSGDTTSKLKQVPLLCFLRCTCTVKLSVEVVARKHCTREICRLEQEHGRKASRWHWKRESMECLQSRYTRLSGWGLLAIVSYMAPAVVLLFWCLFVVCLFRTFDICTHACQRLPHIAGNCAMSWISFRC